MAFFKLNGNKPIEVAASSSVQEQSSSKTDEEIVDELVEKIEVKSLTVKKCKDNFVGVEELGCQFILTYTLDSNFDTTKTGSIIGIGIKYPKEYADLLGMSGSGGYLHFKGHSGYKKVERTTYIIASYAENIDECKLDKLLKTNSNFKIIIYVDGKVKKEIEMQNTLPKE